MPSSEAMGGHTLRSQGPWPGLGTLRSSSGKESLLLALATGFWPKLIESGTEVEGGDAASSECGQWTPRRKWLGLCPFSLTHLQLL